MLLKHKLKQKLPQLKQLQKLKLRLLKQKLRLKKKVLNNILKDNITAYKKSSGNPELFYSV